MDPEDFLAPEVGITAAVVAAIFSPRARKLIRQGAVYGMAGLLVAGDTVASLARNFGQGVQQAGATMANATQNTANQAKAGVSTSVAEAAEAAQKNTTQKSTTAKTKSGTAGE
ncbi:MAG TPA: hypothetical protein VE843_13145 [Ktedonobacteraceae bacterium]|nr:hypothetical protein [Ktedonobacteraceae bacterium]